MRTGTVLVPRIPIVWWEGTQYRGLRGGHFQYRLRHRVQLYWDQLPDSTRVGVAIILELNLGCGYFSGGLSVLP